MVTFIVVEATMQLTICSCGPDRRLLTVPADEWTFARDTYRCGTCGEDQPRCAFCPKPASLHLEGEWVCTPCARECAAELKATLPMGPQSMRELITGRDPEDSQAFPAFDAALWARRSA